MKKQISILAIIAIMMAAILTSCTDGNSYTRVTVLKKAQGSSIRASIIGEELFYEAKTPSGEMVTVVVEEAITLNKKTPYEAIMRKHVNSVYGFVSLEDQEAWFGMKKREKK